MTEAWHIATLAGFTFPATVSSMPYTPSAPEFADMGEFALYARCAIDEALTKPPHRDATYRKYGDPLAALVGGICEAELDGDGVLLSLKAVSLGSLVGGIIAASQRDPDQFRRAQFACRLHLHIGQAFRRYATALCQNGKTNAAALKTLDRAADHLDRAMMFANAMRKLNEQPAQAAE